MNTEEGGNLRLCPRTVGGQFPPGAYALELQCVAPNAAKNSRVDRARDPHSEKNRKPWSFDLAHPQISRSLHGEYARFICAHYGCFQ